MKKIQYLLIYLLLINKLFAADIEILKDLPGDGKKIVNHSWVQIEYKGSFVDGNVFDIGSFLSFFQPETISQLPFLIILIKL